jgi:hypothetical protein
VFPWGGGLMGERGGQAADREVLQLLKLHWQCHQLSF